MEQFVSSGSIESWEACWVLVIQKPVEMGWESLTDLFRVHCQYRPNLLLY